MADFDLNMTLYDANKSIMKTMAPVPEAKMKQDFAGIGAWMSKFVGTEYFMLMCKERSDFTLLHLKNPNYLETIKELRALLEERGTLLGVNYVHGEDCYECWVRVEATEFQEAEVFMFMLFDAQWMVIEVE